MEYGITWNAEPVSKQHGDHATDRVIIGDAQIAIVTDLDAFTQEFGSACVLGIMDGTSVRVMCQDVSRRMLAKNAKPDEIRAAIINRLRGIRNAGARTTTVKTVYTLPNGTTYDGTNITEYRQLYVAALVDAGTPADVALTIGNMQSFTK